MFGYVKPYVPELKVIQYEEYRAVYCGLCRAMGKVTGQLSRLTLSYDLVFLACVRMVITGEKPELFPLHCPLHHGYGYSYSTDKHKVRLALKTNVSLEYTAAVSALLASAKNSDDSADEHGAKKLRASVLSPFVKRMVSLAGEHLPENAESEMLSRLEELYRLEKSGCQSTDITADAFGNVLGYLFSLGLDEERAKTAYAVGYSIGRFTYLCDAADDMEKDAKDGDYNPLLASWGALALDENGQMTSLVRESISVSLPIDLEALSEACEKLDSSHEFTPIIKNIIYLGLPASMNDVLNKVKNHGKSEENNIPKGTENP